MITETVVCSVQDAFAAERCAVDRLEVCARIEVGGLTPDPGEAVQIMNSCNLPCVVMIRPREGNFVYSPAEALQMLSTIALFPGADGFVFGALTSKGTIDEPVCQDLIAAAGRKPCVFHRAFDSVIEQSEGLESLIELGFRRVLTSGKAPTALEGADQLRRLELQARARIEILAGGGIRSYNVRQVVKQSGVTQLHFGPFRNGELDESEVAAIIDELSS